MNNAGDIDRRTYIGGSDIAAILGVSPWKTPLDVYLDKTSGERRITDPVKEKIFTRGKRMEPYIIDILQEEAGLKVIGRNNRYIYADAPFIAAEIDAETEQENIEIKTANPFSAKEWGEQGTDNIPIHYTAQAMHGLMVTGKKECIFGVLIGSDDFRIYRVARDEELIGTILEKEKQFWQRIQEKCPPDPVAVSDINRLFSKDNGESIEANTQTLAALSDLRALKEQERELKKEIESKEDILKLFLADKQAIILNGKPVCTWKTQTASRFNQTAFKQAMPDLYEKFRQTSTSRVFRIK